MMLFSMRTAVLTLAPLILAGATFAGTSCITANGTDEAPSLQAADDSTSPDKSTLMEPGASTLDVGSPPADLPDKTVHWFSLGGGASSTHAPEADGGAITVGYSHRVGRGILTGRFIYAEQSGEEENVSGVGRTRVRPLEHTWASGVLYGWFTMSPKLLASLSGGLSVLGGVRCGELISFERDFLYEEFVYESISYTAVGFPVEVEAYLTPFRRWGFGLCEFVDFNEEKRFFGVLASVLFKV